MNKVNFLISPHRKAWISGSKRLFIAEPYVLYDLKKSMEIEKFDEIITAPHLWQSRNELLAANSFVDQKYQKYLVILSERLNSINQRTYEEIFWKKCFSLALIRYITFIYQTFKLSETFFDPETHDCKILSENSYYIPKNFNEHRDFFQYTAFGQEQLFSVYQKLFNPNRFESFDDEFSWGAEQKKSFRANVSKFSLVTLPKIINKLQGISSGDLLRCNYNIFAKKNSKVAIMGCFFSQYYLNQLINKSKGSISSIKIRPDFTTTAPIDHEKRKFLSSMNSDFDKFDKFFFASMESCFPKDLLEDFSQIESYFINVFGKYPNLEKIVSETWIGDTYTAIGLAIFKSRGGKHIYNEHNFLSQHFLGNSNRYLFSMVDTFVTLGWEEDGVSNLIKGASLFPFTLKRKKKKEYDILFIEGLTGVKAPEFNVSYGEFGSANAERFLNFNELFFKSLSKDTISRIVYRPYPVQMWPVSTVRYPMISYDYHNTSLKKFLQNCKNIDNTPGNSKTLIARSKLVIVNYLSTAYIESILSDVPTVFFWNKDSYYLDGKYSDYYDLLISVGICQTDPVKGALFVEEIADKAEEWWFSEPVRTARKKFLSTNFGEPEQMVDYLLGLTKS